MSSCPVTRGAPDHAADGGARDTDELQIMFRRGRLEARLCGVIALTVTPSVGRLSTGNPEESCVADRADGLAGMHGHNCASAVFVTQKVMAAFDAENGETGLSEGGNYFGPGDARCPAHAAMVTRWMPMNSKS